MSLVVVESAELERLIVEAVHSAMSRAGPADEWVDGRTSPLGRRAFLRLAREGAFPASLVGNKYMARRSDVDAYLEPQRIHPESSRRHPVGGAPNPERRSAGIDAGNDPVARALAAGRLQLVKKSALTHR
jgi:hypothetical protein